MLREYVIYGVNRVAKDFEYMFRDRMKIKYFIAPASACGNMFCGRPVYGEDRLDRTEKVIICDFEKEEKETLLKDRGYEYGKDYFYEKDFFEELDSFRVPGNREIVVWGCGKYGKDFLKNNERYTISFCLDNRKGGGKETCLGYRIEHPDSIDDWSKYYVIITVNKNEEIALYLRKKGLVEGKDFVRIQSLNGLPSRLLQQTIFDHSYYDFTCKTMLNHLEILSEGNTCCCCTTFMKRQLGSISSKTVGEVWNSETHKVLCLSTENRTYSFCEKTMCPFFIEKSADATIKLDAEYETMHEKPKVIALGYDNTCNLKCSTCRNDYIVARGKTATEVMDCSKKIVDELLDQCQFLIAAGDGEVLLSNAYKAVYMDSKCNDIPCIRLLSNGTLFTPQKWSELKQNKSGKILLTVSIDAATADTYAKIRRGGNFKILKENMKFASSLRKCGELSYFRINFVVQKNNYMEMPDFVRWGLELGADEVFFTKILNWGIYSDEEFKEISMMEEDGITPKRELQGILDDPIMKNEIVDLGTIQFSHRPISDTYIDNYYMWEMERKVHGLFGE